MALPSDPIMLLSVVNLKLRDFYPALDALCDDLDADKAASVRKAFRCGLRLRPAAQPVCLIIASNDPAPVRNDCARAGE